jgi:hypothetical protein
MTILPWENGYGYPLPSVLNSINSAVVSLGISNNIPVLNTNLAFAGGIENGYAVTGFTQDGIHPTSSGFASINPIYNQAVGGAQPVNNIAWTSTVPISVIFTYQTYSLEPLEWNPIEGAVVLINNPTSNTQTITCGTFTFTNGTQSMTISPGESISLGASTSGDKIWRLISD